MYTTDTLLFSCGQFSLVNLSQDTSEGVPDGTDALHSQKTSMTISEAVAACLTQAVSERRVTIGVMDCAKLLSSRPGRVMMCILPEVTRDDVTVHIQHVLIRSFCVEHDIRLLTVKDEQRLTSLVTPPPSDSHAPQTTQTTPPRDDCPLEGNNYVSCLLLEESLDGRSEADDFVCGYHDVIVARDILPRPVIQLPD